MFIQCLGSGDAFGSGGRLNSSFFIRTKSVGILLDCGVSALISLKKERLSAADIDTVIISHLHGDHFGGLAFILCEMLALRNRNKNLTIVGPEGTEERTKLVLSTLFPGIEWRDDTPATFITFTSEQELDLQSVKITAYPAVHSPATNPHSLRLVADNKVVAYSGDTEWSDMLLKVSMDADIFICEGSTYDTRVTHHLSVKELLAQRPRINARKIVLTHLGDEALDHIGVIPFSIAADGMILMDE